MAWAACWTLLRSLPSRQLGEQGSWGGSCRCPWASLSSSCPSRFPLSHPCQSFPVYLSVFHLALLRPSETEALSGI